MGMDLTVRYPAAPPTWPAIRDRLATAQFPVTLAMIDGQLAFPDEEPAADWNELRLRTPLGMVTLRRGADSLVCVVWGNADAGTRQAWHAVAWACATVGGGQIETPTGPLDAEAYVRSAELPPELRV
jgi:hypothetical protein